MGWKIDEQYNDPISEVVYLVGNSVSDITAIGTGKSSVEISINALGDIADLLETDKEVADRRIENDATGTNEYPSPVFITLKGDCLTIRQTHEYIKSRPCETVSISIQTFAEIINYMREILYRKEPFRIKSC